MKKFLNLYYSTPYNIITVLVFVAFLFFSYKTFIKDNIEINSFDDCVKNNMLVMESYPRQCRTKDGQIFIEEIDAKITYKNSSDDLIKVDLPYPGAVVGKLFKITGKARGPWFFEASFSVEILDKDGNLLTSSIAKTDEEWMTSEFVNFYSDVAIPPTYIGEATVVLIKSNPSDLRKFDASISFPIKIEY